MTKRTRLILTADGERAFGRLTDGTARALETLLRTEKVKKRDLAERAGIDQAVLSRVLNGTRNLEYRTVAAVVGALGYVFDVVPRKIRADGGSNAAHAQPRDVAVAALNLPALNGTQRSSHKYAVALKHSYV